MNRFRNSDDWVDEEDYLQREVELTKPIPSVRKQAYILIVGDPETGKSMLAWSFTRFPRTAAKRYHSIAINPQNQRNLRKTRNSIGLHFYCAPFISEDQDCFLKEPPEHPPYNLIIYLFDVNRRITLNNILDRWHSNVKNYLCKTRLPPSVLVGNKIDLRAANPDPENLNHETVWPDECEIYADVVDAVSYVEVSALAEINTRDLLVQILRILNVSWEPDF